MSEIDGRIFAALAEPFPMEELEFRVQSSGLKNGRPWARVLTYVANRAIMNRLDQIVGPENWQNQFKVEAGGMLCGLGLRLGGEWVWKWDGSSESDVEPFKGGLSGAMKRAAVQWGLGRYLYNLEATWANVHDGGQYRDRAKDRQTNTEVWFNWDPPPMPAWALPGGTGYPGPSRGGVSQADMEGLHRDALGRGFTAGEFTMAFMALHGRMTDDGRIDYRSMSRETFDKVAEALASRDQYSKIMAPYRAGNMAAAIGGQGGKE